MRKAVYAGSFDPLTKGHSWMIENGSKLFDELVVAIGINPDKKYTFSLDERVDMLRRLVRKFPNVEAQTFENQFLAHYTSSVGAQYILRGIRTEGDYEYERGMRHINSDLDSRIVTNFWMPPREISEISSSLVKGLVGPKGWEEIVENYIPREVYNQFLLKFRGLEIRWKQLWKRIGTNGSGKDNYEEIARLYGETHRYYHNFVHIAHSLNELNEASRFIENPNEVETAIWYHDAIYDIKAKNNEEKSAELAEKILTKARIKKQFIKSVTEKILATKHDMTPKDKDTQYLIDIDLAILGKPTEEFEEYERDIRSEYSFVPEYQFKQKRKEILQNFLCRNSVYSTDFFKQKYESQARKNLERLITQLS